MRNGTPDQKIDLLKQIASDYGIELPGTQAQPAAHGEEVPPHIAELRN